MLWLKISVIAGAVLLAVLTSVFKTGLVSELSETVGVQKQAIVQKEQALSQAKQLIEEAEIEAIRSKKAHQEAMAALEARDAAYLASEQKAAELITRIRRLSYENQELRQWRDTLHPDDVVRLLNDATPTASGTDSDNPDGGREATEWTD